jgi:outer membrane protein assembly factor BamB
MKKIQEPPSAISTRVNKGVLLLSLLCFALPATAQDSVALVNQLLKKSGKNRGLVALSGIDGDLPLQLARKSELLVHVRDSSEEAVQELRRSADTAGFGIDRLVAERGGTERLPYADNTVDFFMATKTKGAVYADDTVELFVNTQAKNANREPLKAGEVLRALTPRGTAIVGIQSHDGGKANFKNLLEKWAGDGATSVQTWTDETGVWIQFEKPPQVGADDWSHWEKGPDNNPVSTDQIIKAPYMTQFLADPKYIGMPSVTTASAGRTFLAIGHIAHHEREWSTLYKLIARNGHNGIVLWERDLPEGYLVHRSAFIATPDTFYMMEGDRCLMLDAATGVEKGEIRIPGLAGDWKWMAMHNGLLYVLAGKPEPKTETTKGDRSFGGWSWADLSKGYYGKRIPFGFGDTLAAYDITAQNTVWLHKEDRLIDSRGLAIRDDKFYLYCPDLHLRCLAAFTGETVWTNANNNVLGLIERPGRKLISTPGFRTQCMVVATPQALIVQGQTRMNVVGISTENGKLLWTKKKITNNPNAIYVDGKIVLGVGERGSNLLIDPVSGSVEEDLYFTKTACTRLTATPDSFFCRGEGTLRYDRLTKKVLIDGSVRPACNDGALAANGMLYIGPWQCDCNLSIIGLVGKCSAGDFKFDRVALDSERLEAAAESPEPAEPGAVTAGDWPTYRANNHRSAGSTVPLKNQSALLWTFEPNREYTPTAPTSTGNAVFLAGNDGKIRAIDAASGALRWEILTPAPIKYPPTVWNGRAYVGGSDGYVYCLDASNGTTLWRFRAAPVERHMMVYGNLSSTWPANSGVLVHEGVAYVAAGIIDSDGTYVYALDAKTGKTVWQNNSSGHLNAELRKGVSVQGNLSIEGEHLLLAGGNQVTPARYELATGKCLAEPFDQGRPKANNGKFVGVFGKNTPITGGRILFSSPKNVSTKGGFDVITGGRKYRFNFGGIPPAWDDNSLAFVNLKHGKLSCLDAAKVITQIDEGLPNTDASDRPRPRWLNTLAGLFEDKGNIRWQTDMDEPKRFEVVSLAVCPNAVVAVVRFQAQFRAKAQWWLIAFNQKNGSSMFRHELIEDPLPGGLLIDSRGQIVVTMLDGNVLCYGEE